ncbi:hypothetical protein [Endozoicomonas numazuensis]|uniref:hypothetical protein n=1 Tax=Endozoicomonas numazuensis TaxID=1137799 RepID=UPI000ADF4878|nr:hypothetical protein [Endozoicomonas numazuensis]
MLCSVEQMERCAEGLTALEPVMVQNQELAQPQPSVVNNAEIQEEPVIEQQVVVPEETASTATFYF